MYGVQNRFGSQWVIVDARGQAMCSGTMRQCEDWLDCRDNLPARVAAPVPRVTAVFKDALATVAVAS